jgi:hypothetical protein
MIRTRISTIRVVMPDGSMHPVGRLLGGGNFKYSKCEHLYPAAMTAHLSLAPNTTAGPRSVCANSTPGCRRACLFFGGRGQLHTIRRARIARTVLLWQDSAGFERILRRDLDQWSERARRSGRRLFIRLNALADLEWEVTRRWVFNDYPTVFYYDYTKLGHRLTSPHRPANYSLTFSRSESNETECRALLKAGHSVAIVFRRKPFPARFWDHCVIDGTVHDLRPLDPPGSVVALLALGRG